MISFSAIATVTSVVSTYTMASVMTMLCVVILSVVHAEMLSAKVAALIVSILDSLTVLLVLNISLVRVNAILTLHADWLLRIFCAARDVVAHLRSQKSLNLFYIL